jgi:hypothetical protein
LHTTVNEPKIMSKEELIELAIVAGNSKDDKLDTFFTNV